MLESSRIDGNLPTVRNTKKVLAIFTADTHFSHNVPRSRAEEPDWYEAQLRVIHSIREAIIQYDCPHVVFAGDIFHTSHECSQLVNFLLDNLPEGIAIPGNHDMPYHRYTDWKKSPFGTLVLARKFRLLEPDRPTEIPGKVPVRLHGFPVGFPVKPLENSSGLTLEVAVVHDYIWCGGHRYPGMAEGGSVQTRLSTLKGYDTAFFGDNHIPFSLTKIKPAVVNCGSLQLRSVKEDHKPRLWLLYEDGSVGKHYLDTSQDKKISSPERQEVDSDPDTSTFITEITKVAKLGVNFEELLRRALNNKEVSQAAREAVLNALERSYDG